MLAQEKGLQLRVCHCSLTVLSDPVLLEQLLCNLLSNAIKYTDQGKVLVGCRRQGQTVILQVLDTGCGIADHAREQIFDIYHRSAGGETAPVVALAFTDRELGETVSVYLRRWQQTPVVFDSLGQALGSDADITVLLCDQDSLEGSMLSMEQARPVAQSTALACVCEPGTPLPEPWIALSPHALPVQLRALLNTEDHERKPGHALTGVATAEKTHRWRDCSEA